MTAEASYSLTKTVGTLALVETQMVVSPGGKPTICYSLEGYSIMDHCKMALSLAQRRRRQLLVAGAAGLSTLGLSRQVRAASERVDVAIVGAGLSGLYAGMLLTNLGAKVMVLEASDRSGGRCRTADQWLATPDLGGAQVGNLYARFKNVAHELGVKLAPGAHMNAPYSPVVDGQLISPDKWASSKLNLTEGAEREVPPHALTGHYVNKRTPFNELIDWMKPEAAEYDISVAEWLKRQGASPEATRIIYESYGAKPLEERSLLRMLQEATRGQLEFKQLDAEKIRHMDQFEIAATISSHVVGGTSRLTDAMTASLEDRVRFQRPVAAVDQDETGCTLQLLDGSKVRADLALVATPFSMARQIAFSPALKGVQAEAVNSMFYNNQSQVWLEVKSPYWEDDGLDASMWTDGPFTLIRQQIESDGSRVLMSALAFSEKSLTIDAMSPKERGKFAIAEIERIRPSTRGKLAFVGAHSWWSEKYIQACSYDLAPGRAQAWAEHMGKPHGRVHFAGEHLRRLEVGMEGAMESGERAALEILERLDARTTR